jgi:hypothetical protein
LIYENVGPEISLYPSGKKLISYQELIQGLFIHIAAEIEIELLLLEIESKGSMRFSILDEQIIDQQFFGIQKNVDRDFGAIFQGQIPRKRGFGILVPEQMAL